MQELREGAAPVPTGEGLPGRGGRGLLPLVRRGLLAAALLPDQEPMIHYYDYPSEGRSWPVSRPHVFLLINYERRGLAGATHP